MRAEGEPEKLVLPAAGVRELLELALRTEPGAALWRGFVLAHGEPSWLTERRFAFRVDDGAVVPIAPVVPHHQSGTPGAGSGPQGGGG